MYRTENLSASYLKVSNLRFSAGNGDVLLSETSFEVEEGAILAIAGPNGAGKTTLLNLLAGAVRSDAGDVSLNGVSLVKMSAQDRARRIAVVGQQELPDGRLFVRDYVAMGQIPIQAEFATADHRADLDTVLALTDLTSLAGKRVETLSGGERQRAHIARALAQRPQILFLDEPTNHLDPDSKGRVLSLIAGLGITVVMVVHDIVMIPEFATHVALMQNTCLTAFGAVGEVLTPKNVQGTFGVAYLQFNHEGRTIPALDIQKTSLPTDTRKPAL